MILKSIFRSLLCLLTMASLGACHIVDRLEDVGKPPDLEPISNPVARAGYQPVSLPMPAPDQYRSAGSNSLWREGARGFFKDQRARRVGDILTVDVTVADSAELSNESSRGRNTDDDFGMTSLFGLQNRIDNILPGPIDPSSLVDLNSSMDNFGTGEIERSETISFNIAAVVIQILPNGNLVIEGRQEIRVNFEVREILVAGVVRPEDISPANTIDENQIAELRVAYGGRGQITDVQQPRYGAQVLDIILPY